MIISKLSLNSKISFISTSVKKEKSIKSLLAKKVNFTFFNLQKLTIQMSDELSKQFEEYNTELKEKHLESGAFSDKKMFEN